ncbi:hypothetical protein [Hahella chejuensis]|uniref:hypothetical protein n=1 Tax=Hahella chejuensis TaxID=158327 RepID=UPI0002F0AAC3|nr:hypothetical protein [Hahella chejuensis]
METRELERFMGLAIAEGRKAIAHCRPNPPVGCVLALKRWLSETYVLCMSA